MEEKQKQNGADWKPLKSVTQLKKDAIIRYEFTNEEKQNETRDYKILQIDSNVIIVEDYSINDSITAVDDRIKTNRLIKSVINAGILIKEV